MLLVHKPNLWLPHYGLAYRKGRLHRLNRKGAILVPNVGEVLALNRFLGRTAAGDMTLALFNSSNTPTELDTLGTYGITTFVGYAPKTLTAATWAAPTTAAPTDPGVTSSVYAVQTWTCTGAGDTVYGALYIDVTTGVLVASDKFSTQRTIANTDTLSFTPRWEAA